MQETFRGDELGGEVLPTGGTHVNKLLLLPLILCSSSLVLEDDVVVPPALDVEVRLVQERVPQGDVPLPLFFFGRGPLALLDESKKTSGKSFV